MNKKSLRQKAKEWVKSLTKEKKYKLDEQISKHIEDFYHYLKTDKVLVLGVYSPLADEVNWNAKLTLDPSTVISYPVMTDDKNLEYWVFSEEKKKVAQVVPDLILVPGLMFSKTGDRLGRGGGYFDRFLPKFEGITIGIVYENNLSQWESEDHDQAVHGVITEAGLIDINIKVRNT